MGSASPPSSARRYSRATPLSIARKTTVGAWGETAMVGACTRRLNDVLGGIGRTARIEEPMFGDGDVDLDQAKRPIATPTINAAALAPTIAKSDRGRVGAARSEA